MSGRGLSAGAARHGVKQFIYQLSAVAAPRGPASGARMIRVYIRREITSVSSFPVLRQPGLARSEALWPGHWATGKAQTLARTGSSLGSPGLGYMGDDDWAICRLLQLEVVGSGLDRGRIKKGERV